VDIQVDRGKLRVDSRYVVEADFVGR